MTIRYRCPEVDPTGRQCVLSAGHSGSHEVARPPRTGFYKGSPQDAAAQFQRDAAAAAADGYYPVSQQYTPGSWGCAAFLVALLLCIVLIGILIFIYLIIVKPAGMLVVVYEYRPPESAPPLPPEAQPRPMPDPTAALSSLADMRDKGLITAEEYEAKKKDLLDRM